MKTQNDYPVSATYVPTAGLLQRTLKNETTISVLFGEVGRPTEGKKGLYLNLPKPEMLIGRVFPTTVSDGVNVMSGTLTINDYCENENQRIEAEKIGIEYVVGSYNVTLKIGRLHKTKNLKHHDLATLWCLATDMEALALREMLLQLNVDTEKRNVA